MNIELFVQKASNLFVSNRLLRFVVVVLAVAFVFNSIMVYRAVRYQKVVLIPPHMTGTVEFVQGKPTENYVTEIARRVVSLASTYSPPTARKQFEEVLFYYAPEAYPDASRSWYSLASRVEESQVSSVFYIEKYTLKDNSIEVFGDLKQFAGTAVIENASRTYRIEYQIRDGRFEITSFKEKSLTEEGNKKQ